MGQTERDYWNSDVGRVWTDHQSELDRLFSEVSALLLDRAAPGLGERVLDIGCGAGATTLAAQEATGENGQALGADISAPMLARATERAKAESSRAHFILADAQTHPFAPDHFDLAMSRFGVMFFDDSTAAFRNIARALRPGGRITFVCWAAARDNPWFAINGRITQARLGPLPQTAPDAPGPFRFAETADVVAMLQAAGLSDCAGQSVECDLHHPGGLPGAMELAEHLGPLSRMRRERAVPQADVDAVLDEMRDAYASFIVPDGIRIPARLNLFTARKD